MSRIFRNVRATLDKLWGTVDAPIDYGIKNNVPLLWKNQGGVPGDGSGSIEALNVDLDDNVVLGKEIIKPDRLTLQFHIEPNGSIADQVLWISDGVYKVEAIYEVHKTKDTASPAVTGTIRKSADGITMANGIALCTALSLETDDDTVQAATLSTATHHDGSSVLNLAENDRISITYDEVTDFAGMCITLVLSPAHRSESVTFSVVANGVLADRTFFCATRRMKITAMKYSHATAGSASGVNVQITKDTTTNAPGAGTNLLQNDSDAGFDCEETADTVQDGDLTATAAELHMLAGDYLSVDFSGTLTALAGVVITVFFEPIMDRKEVTFFCPSDGAAIVEQNFFIADRNYEIIAAIAVWDVASGGATNMQVTLDTGTDAPGAGTDLLSNDGNAGFQSDGTARTPEVATFVDARENFLYQGERLSLDPNGTMTSLVGLVITVSLKPV